MSRRLGLAASDDAHLLAVDHALQPFAGSLTNRARVEQHKTLPRCRFENGSGQRMLRVSLHARGGLQRLRLVHAWGS